MDLNFEVNRMTIKELRQKTGLTKTEFCKKYSIQTRTLEHWEHGDRACPAYALGWLEALIENGLEPKKEQEE